MKLLLTGGAGFIGCNLAAHFLRAGHTVTIYDNFSRRGAESNLAWLQANFAAGLRVLRADVRDAAALAAAARDQDALFHLAGQVAVTTSVTDPRADFEANAVGTFNALEAARLSGRQPIFIYTSTNKVYGGMENVEIVEEATRWRYKSLTEGCPETQPLDFHSPYGTSKGSGDQYTRDYARIYGLRSVVFRQSCIYGPRQWGIEDQGWLAWMMIAAVTGKQITIYGDGKQVRDILHVHDLLNAYDAAVEKIDRAKGEIYNIGGGPRNMLAVWTEFGPILERLMGRKIEVAHADWRPGDQRVFYADFSKAKRELGWEPKIDLEQGLEMLFNWVKENRDLFQ